MRVLLWHGWLLEGSGSNVTTANVARIMRAAGHDVALLCQEPHPERFEFIDAWGAVGPDGPSLLHVEPRRAPARGRVVLLRPEIGDLLPVFVLDEYEGIEAKRFVDLSSRELAGYLESNEAALRAAVAWHTPDAVVVGHAVAGPAVAARALGPGRFVSKVHGSDLEYAVRAQARYQDLAREGLEASRAVLGPSRDALDRVLEFVPAVADRARIVPPGVDTDAFRPLPRPTALREAARRLDADPARRAGRPGRLDSKVAAALDRRDAEALDRLALDYDQEAPDPDAPARLNALAPFRGPVVGYLGKLIPEKGVEVAVQAIASIPNARGLIVGFGRFREWLVALAMAIGREDREAMAWIGQASPLRIDPAVVGDPSLTDRLSFTGRLDHRYAPLATAATDVLVVPSTLPEAFGMVAAEAAAAGTLPVVARHSGLAEVSAALEHHVGRPGAFGFDPGPGSVGRLTAAVEALLGLRSPERAELKGAIRSFVTREWSWQRCAERILDAALP